MPTKEYIYTRVNSELINKVKDLKRKYPNMSGAEISEITGWTSPTSVNRILNGEYDSYLMGNDKPTFKKNESNQYSALLEEVRTFRERYMELSDEQNREILDILKANNALLADIATMLVNKIECPEHNPSKASESHFRDMIISNRIKS